MNTIFIAKITNFKQIIGGYNTDIIYLYKIQLSKSYNL
jgi:hypothetical protein